MGIEAARIEDALLLRRYLCHRFAQDVRRLLIIALGKEGLHISKRQNDVLGRCLHRIVKLLLGRGVISGVKRLDRLVEVAVRA